MANREFHEQFNPPPVGAATGFNGQEQVFPTKDAANDMEQLQHRITQFQDGYPRIEKFYKEFSKVVLVDETNVDATLDEEQLFHEFSRAVETHIDEEQAKIRQAEEEKQREEQERLAREEAEREALRQAEEEAAAKAREAAEAVRFLSIPFIVSPPISSRLLLQNVLHKKQPKPVGLISPRFCSSKSIR